MNFQWCRLWPFGLKETPIWCKCFVSSSLSLAIVVLLGGCLLRFDHSAESSRVLCIGYFLLLSFFLRLAATRQSVAEVGADVQTLQLVVNLGACLFRLFLSHAQFCRHRNRSDSSTANSLTDRLGAGQRTKHIDTRYFWIQERVQDGGPQCLGGACSEELRRCWNEASLCLIYYSNIASLQDWYSINQGSHTPLQDEGHEAYDGSGEGTAPPI